jgi:hypothetical protein
MERLAAPPDNQVQQMLGKLLLYDKQLSVNRNEACTFCHMPEAGFTGPASELNRTRLCEGLRAQRYFTSPKAIVHFYNTRDVLPRCQPHDVNEGTTCWPAPESTDYMNRSRVGRLGPSDGEEDAIVRFMRTLTDGFTPANH